MALHTSGILTQNKSSLEKNMETRRMSRQNHLNNYDIKPNTTTKNNKYCTKHF